MKPAARTAILLAAIVALIGAGILLATRSTDKPTESPERRDTVAQTPAPQSSEASADENTEAVITDITEPAGAEPQQPKQPAEKDEENSGDTQTDSGAQSADSSSESDKDASHDPQSETASSEAREAPPDTHKETQSSEPAATRAPQMDEETFIDLSVEIVITAMGMENSDTPQEELQHYVKQRLEQEGYSAGAFKDATDRILADPERSEQVSRKILQRVKKQTGVQMDMRVLPMLDPRWKEAGFPDETDDTEKKPAQ